MKNRIFKLATGFAALWMAMPDPVGAQQSNPDEMGGMLLMADGKRMRGFVQNSNENGILFSLVEGATGTGYAWSQVRAVALDDANDIMRNPRAAFAAGVYDRAAELFGKIADTFERFAFIPDNFVCEARYYQIEALRLLGRFEEIAPLVTTPSGSQILRKLPEFYHSQHKLNIVWGRLGAGDLDGVKAAVDTYEQPLEGPAQMLPGPTFKPMPAHEVVQLTYLRSKVYRAAGQKDLALQDLYRTFTLTHAGNSVLAKRAMVEAMEIQKEDPMLGDEKRKTALHQMQSLAFFFKNGMNKGEIDEGFVQFAVKPDVPRLAEPQPEEEKADSMDAQAAEDGAEKPAAEAMAEDAKKEDAEQEPKKPEDKKPGDKKSKKKEKAKPEEAKPEEAKPEEAKPEEAKPEEAKPEEPKAGEANQ